MLCCCLKNQVHHILLAASVKFYHCRQKFVIGLVALACTVYELLPGKVALIIQIAAKKRRQCNGVRGVQALIKANAGWFGEYVHVVGEYVHVVGDYWS